MGSEANAPFRSYEEFDPSFEWVRTDPSMDIVAIDLPGFEKEHLKVQIDTVGNLRTSGSRPVDGNRWIRFWKDFRVPENCSVKGIRAKFENEKLYLLIPKSDDGEAPTAAAPAPPQKAAAEDDKKQQRANGKSTEPVNARQGLDERKEKLKRREETKPSGAEEKTAPPPPPLSREDLDKREEKKMLQSKEEDKPNGGGKKKTAPAPAPARTAKLEPKSNDKSSDEKKTVSPPAATSSKAGDGGVEGAAEGQGMAGIARGLTRARKGLLLNVAIATLVLLGLALYLKYQLTRAETK